MKDIITWIIAKTDPEDETLWLPLVYHLADTAGVMRHLTKLWLPAAVKQSSGMTAADFDQVALFLAWIHDLGKCSPVFQQKISQHFPELVAAMAAQGLLIESDKIKDAQCTPHGRVGADILRSRGCPETIAEVVGAHHGRTEDGNTYKMGNLLDFPNNYYGADSRSAWQEAQGLFIDRALHASGYTSMSDLPELPLMARMLLTGLLIMADWIASNTRYFPLIPVEDVPRPYDQRRVERAVKRLNLPAAWAVSEEWKYADLYKTRFGYDANAVQQTMKRVAETMPAPGLMILEAPMGKGKTEAALAAAEILMNRFQLGGVGFFLPSQATGNAMFTRLHAWAEQQPNAERLTIALAHAMAEMNDEFAALAEGRVSVNEDAASFPERLEVHSFFRGRKTSLLANLVVGTVDQLLMAGLMQKHVMLRHLGLAGKVVIVDECHAYDAYMNMYLDRVLAWLGTYGTPVILLSATLPGARRAALLQAYCGARRCDEAVAQREDYPLLTWTEGGVSHLEPIPLTDQSTDVRVLRGTEEDMAAALRAASAGCVGIIVNTVKRVQAVAAMIREALPEAVLLIDHAQFVLPDRLTHEAQIMARVGKRSTMADRAGVIVLGTQVLEQSLDLDFDLLVTDLCPMDLLLQRIGRLHRHPDRDRPAVVAEARCMVLHADPQALEDGAKAVYGEYLLLRTCGLLPENIHLPGDISPLVQRVYDEARWEPEEDAAYLAAKEKYHQHNGNQEGKAKGYCLKKPGKGRLAFFAGLMEADLSMNDPQAQAAVRDGESSVEVLVVRDAGNGRAELLSGEEAGTLIPMDCQPDGDTARLIAHQRLRLPGWFSRPFRINGILRIDRTLQELTAQTERLSEWRMAPMLAGELFLLLDGGGQATLSGMRLTYDGQSGLRYEEEKDGAD